MWVNVHILRASEESIKRIPRSRCIAFATPHREFGEDAPP